MSVVILLAMQRSGTQALGSILDQHASIEYLGEVFHDKHLERTGNYFSFLKQRMETDADLVLPHQAPERFRQYLAHLTTVARKEVSVLDVKYASTHHFEKYWKNPWAPPFFIQLLATHQIPVIHLTRRNLFRQYVSNLMAEQTNVWNLKQQATGKPQQLVINTQTLLAEIDMRESHARLMAQHLMQCPFVTSFDYADLFDGDELSHKVSAQLSGFLAVPGFEKRRPAFYKQNPNELEDVIANMTEVTSIMRDSKFSWMLDD